MSNWSLTIPEEIYDAAGQDVALPAFYEKACLAIQECEALPDLNEWKGKAEAIIAYAKTLEDTRLENYAKRIKARAYRRMGQLLEQYDGSGNNQHTVPKGSKLSRKEVAEQAGITEKQQRTAVNMARNDNFESQLEAEQVPKITELAKPGIKKNKAHDKKPEGFTEAMYLKADIKRLIEKMEEYDPIYIIGGMSEADQSDMVVYIHQIEAWCDTFIMNMK